MSKRVRVGLMAAFITAAIIGCGSADSESAAESETSADEATASPSPTATAAAEPAVDPTVAPIATPRPTSDAEGTLPVLHAELATVIRPEAVPWSDLTLLADLGEETREVIARILVEIPDEADGMRTALEAWDADIAAAVATIDSDLARLQPLAAEWIEAEPKPGPPPREITDLTDTILFIGAERYREACTAFATANQQALACATITEDPNRPQADAFELVTATIGSVTLQLDPGVAFDVIAGSDLVGIELTADSTFTLFLPPPVADPAEPLNDAAVTSPIPWPSDPVAWSSEVGSVAGSRTVELGGVTYLTAVVERADDLAAVIDNPAHPNGAHFIGPDGHLQWWQAEIGGQVVVALLESVNAPEIASLEPTVEGILASIEVISS